MNECRLIIISLNDAQAKCSCKKWHYFSTDSMTKEEIKEKYKYHIQQKRKHSNEK
jgi:hypothetical protein